MASFNHKFSTHTSHPYNQNSWWFTGNGSFVSNGYVIYKGGLDGDLPNPIALNQGGKEYNRIISPSTNPLSNYSQLINYLNKIKDMEAEKEKEFLRAKLSELRGVIPDDYW